MRKGPDGKWFNAQAVGIHTLSKMLPRICEMAGIEGRKTNRSLRKTTCSRLLKAGVHPTTVMQLTGHKNVQSLNDYDHADINEQRSMSAILANPNSQSQSTAVTPYK